MRLIEMPESAARWGKMSAHEVLDELNVDENQGLSTQRAAKNTKPKNNIYIQELFDVWALVLLFTFILVALKSQSVWTLLTVGSALCLKTGVSIWQFLQKQQLKQELTTLNQQYLNVIRSSRVVTIEKSKLVIGDIVVISAGIEIPVFMKMLKVRNLKVDESEVNGASFPIAKSVVGRFEKTILSPRSIVSSGSGLAVCVSEEPLHPGRLRLQISILEISAFLVAAVVALFTGNIDGWDRIFLALSLGSLVAPLCSGFSNIQKELHEISTLREFAKSGIYFNRICFKEVANCNILVADKKLLINETSSGRDARFRLGAESGISVYGLGTPNIREKLMLNEGHWLGLNQTAIRKTANLNKGAGITLGVSSNTILEDAFWATDIRAAARSKIRTKQVEVELSKVNFESLLELILGSRRFVIRNRLNRSLSYGLFTVLIGMVVVLNFSSLSANKTILLIAVVVVIWQLLGTIIISRIVSSNSVARLNPLSI